MFRCNDCGCEFEAAMVVREHHGLDYGFEEIGVCPCCGESDYTEAHRCEICGEYTFNDHYCDGCMDEAKARLRDDFKYFKKARVSDLTDLFTYALDDINVEDRNGLKIQRPAAG